MTKPICKVAEDSLIGSETDHPDTHCWREETFTIYDGAVERSLHCDEVPTHEVTMKLGYTFGVCELHAKTVLSMTQDDRGQFIKKIEVLS